MKIFMILLGMAAGFFLITLAVILGHIWLIKLDEILESIDLYYEGKRYEKECREISEFKKKL